MKYIIFEMRKRDADLRTLLVYGIAVLGLLLYLYGFFPFEKSFHSVESGPHKRNYTYEKRLFDKLVLIVIDALRYDFVLPPDNEEFMSFTTRSIKKNESCFIKLRAEAPTVTMPRLKAMTSGIVPTYFDVVSNFIGSNFKLDSFIQQAKNRNLRIVFYGDDTWINLFPQAFVRSEGTNSFFASDFTEVDNNVTRHLSEEFKKNDWDFLILHYLGLDHIGHVHGPKSSLMKPKLNEMDSIILRIFEYLKESGSDVKKSLLLITSDHGMKDSGGHGGVTHPEITLPLVSIGKSCNYLPGWPVDAEAAQIDLSSTISAAFGLSLPGSNEGKLIPSLLSGVDCESVLNALEINRQQLASRASLHNENVTFADKTLPFGKCSSKSREDVAVTKEITQKYYRELVRLSTGLQQVSEFQHSYLISGVFIMWLSLIALFLRCAPAEPSATPRKITHFFLLLGTCLVGLSYFSTSFIEEEHQTWYFLWVTLCALALLESLNFGELTVSQTAAASFPWIMLLVGHRILRKLNQTGDRWAMLPDIKGFLNSKKNHSWLIAVYASGVLGLFWCAAREDCSRCQLLNFGAALFVGVMYRLSVRSFHLDFLSFYPRSGGHWECNMFWVLAALFTIQTVVRRKPFHLVWSLVASLLLKPYNVILISVQILTSRLFCKLYSEDRFWNNVAHIWMGYVFYFYQGNSNSIANVDVAAGFVGLAEYVPVRSGAMIAAHTNSAHVLAFLLSPRSNFIYSLLRLFPLSFYCTILIRYLDHLFIWSVFSPKLLYEANFSLVVLLLIFLNCFGSSRYSSRD